MVQDAEAGASTSISVVPKNPFAVAVFVASKEARVAVAV